MTNKIIFIKIKKRIKLWNEKIMINCNAANAITIICKEKKRSEYLLANTKIKIYLIEK